MRKFVHQYPITALLVALTLGGAVVEALNGSFHDAVTALVTGLVVAFGFWVLEN